MIGRLAGLAIFLVGVLCFADGAHEGNSPTRPRPEAPVRPVAEPSSRPSTSEPAATVDTSSLSPATPPASNLNKQVQDNLVKPLDQLRGAGSLDSFREMEEQAKVGEQASPREEANFFNLPR